MNIEALMVCAHTATSLQAHGEPATLAAAAVGGMGLAQFARLAGARAHCQ
jgi:hypothetical protein